MRGSILPRGKGVYLVRISLGRDSVTCKRLYHSETVHGDKKAAEKHCRDLVTRFERGDLVKRSTQSLNEYLKDWLDTAAKNELAQRTAQDYEGLISRYVREDLGRVPLSALTTTRIQKTYNDMTDRGLSPVTVRHLHAVLNKALGQAVKLNLLSFNAAKVATLPKKKRGTVKRSMSPEQAQSFLGACHGHRFGMVLIFALLTGMRPEEFLALLWEDIDWADCSASVNKVLFRPKGGGWKFEEPKTAASRRIVTLDHRLLLLLKKHRVGQVQARLQAGPRWDSSHHFVFANEFGGPMSANNLLLRGFNEVLKLAGIPKEFRMYDLRHTHITLLIQEAKENPRTVGDRCGHSDIAMTLGVYTSVLSQAQRDAARKVGDILGLAD